MLNNIAQDSPLDIIPDIPNIFWYVAGGLLLVYILSKIYFYIYNTYFVVVPPSQVHIVVTKTGRNIYWTKTDDLTSLEAKVHPENTQVPKIKQQSSYWFWPWWMTRQILPLEIIKMEIDNVELHDEEYAPFMADIRCWVVIEKPLKAAERIGDIYHDAMTHVTNKQRIGRQLGDIRSAFKQVESDVKDIIQSVARYASMNISLDTLMKNREAFKQSIYTQIDIDLEEWGLGLKTLEILHIKDHADYHVIADFEAMRSAQIDAKSRTEVAQRQMEAEIAESDNSRVTRLQVADNERESRQKEIDTAKEISLSEQAMALDVEKAKQEANEQQIKAERVIAVGQAEYNAQALVRVADGERESQILKAQGESEAIILQATGQARSTELAGEAQALAGRVRGKSEADVVQMKKTADAEGTRAILLAEAQGSEAKLLAEASGIKAKLTGEAEGKEKLAKALKEYEEAGLSLENLYAARDVLIAQAQVMGEAYKTAKVSVITGGQSNILGLPVGPEQGASIGAMLESLRAITGKSIEENIEDLKNIKTVKDKTTEST